MPRIFLKNLERMQRPLYRMYFLLHFQTKYTKIKKKLNEGKKNIIKCLKLTVAVDACIILSNSTAN